MNLRIWAADAGVTITHLRTMRPSRGSRPPCGSRSSMVVGRRRAGWARTVANVVDVRGEFLEIVWERAAPAVRGSGSIQDDPLWDDGLDGGPVG